MNDNDFKKVFIEHKVEVPDEGFSKRIIRQLPERKRILPQIVMVVSIIAGFLLTFSIQGVTSLITQINDLITSISNLQAPSPISVLTYFVLLGITGLISYSLVKVES